MKNVTVKDIVFASKGELLSGSTNTPVEKMTTDSRVIPENALFVPIVGEKTDAHAFVRKAMDDGCTAVVISKRSVYEEYAKDHPDTDKAFILVDDTTKAVQRIARMARTHLSIPAVGITGSVGKTTTRVMVSAALAAEKKVYKTDKNYNNWLGVPITLCEMNDDDDIAVLELGLNVRGELGLISSLCNLETAVITNIGVAHIEFYGTQDEICKEKFTVTNGFWEDNYAPKMLFLNGDDPYLMKYRDLTGYPYTIYGTQENAKYRAVNIRQENGQYVFDLSVDGEIRVTVSLNVPGVHNILNAAAALAVADHYHVDLQKAAESLGAFAGFKSRLERHEVRGSLIIDDTYNASPASMKAGLDVLCSYQYGDGKGRRIAVLGDMFELGENAPQYHYEVGEYAASKNIDLMLLTGVNAREIGRALKDRNSSIDCRFFESKDEITAFLKEELSEGDIVYLKASNGMKLTVIAEGLCR